MKLSNVFAAVFAAGSVIATAAIIAFAAFIAVQQQPSIAFAAEPLSAIAQREAQYQTQIAEANRLLVERQTIYTEQVKELSSRIAVVRANFDALSAQEAALEQQLGQLQSVRTERLNGYEQQLTTAKTEYALRFEQLQAELQTAQAQLAEANAALGR